MVSICHGWDLAGAYIAMHTPGDIMLPMIHTIWMCICVSCQGTVAGSSTFDLRQMLHTEHCRPCTPLHNLCTVHSADAQHSLCLNCAV